MWWSQTALSARALRGVARGAFFCLQITFPEVPRESIPDQEETSKESQEMCTAARPPTRVNGGRKVPIYGG